MSATTTVIVPLAVKALTNEQLLALYNRWSTKPCKKFEKRTCGEQRVARLLEDLEMSVEDACAPPSDDGYAGDGWDVAFPATQEAAEATEEASEETIEETESVSPEPIVEETQEPVAQDTQTLDSVFLAIGGLPGNATPMAWAPDLAKKLKLPILIVSKTGEVLETFEPTSAKKEKRAARATEGMSKSCQAVFDLVSRPEGATAKELLAATGWAQGSWPPMCNRIARQKSMYFHQEKVDGVTRYYVSSRD